MMKVILIFVAGLLLSGSAFAETYEISETKVKFSSQYTSSDLQTRCVDGYKYVIIRAPDAVSIVQAFEEKNGNSVPSKC